MALSFSTTSMDTQTLREFDLVKHVTYSYIPLRQYARRAISRRPNGRIATESVWLKIVGYLDGSLCIYRKQKALNSLSLTCRFFNEFATKALYETLDLQFHGERDLGPSKCSCSVHKKLAIESNKPRKRHPLRNKLNRLIRTLRSRPGIASQILHLKLPHEHPLPNLIEQPHGYQSDAGDSVNPIFLKWFEIFKLSSPGLYSVSGLESLLEEFQDRGFLRLDIGNELWAALEHNKHWQQWDFTGWSSAYLPGLNVFGFPPLDLSLDTGWSIGRLQQTFASWKNLQHVTLEDTAWLQGALHSLPRLQSVTINANGFTNFNNLFQHIPAKNLKSLSYNCLEPQAEERRFMRGPDYLGSEPFVPFIRFLENTNSSPLLPILTKIDINFQWWNDEHRPYKSGMCNFRQLASSIFSSVSMLEELNITIATFHEREIGNEAGDLVQELEQHSITPNTALAPHLRSMSLSLPAQTNKGWLARKISSGAFPNLRDFTFRSSLSKGKYGDCTRCVDIENPKSLRSWAKGQDQLLINACQEVGVDRWIMKTRNNPENNCPIFAIDEGGDAGQGETGYDTWSNISGP